MAAVRADRCAARASRDTICAEVSSPLGGGDRSRPIRCPGAGSRVYQRLKRGIVRPNSVDVVIRAVFASGQRE